MSKIGRGMCVVTWEYLGLVQDGMTGDVEVYMVLD